MKSGGISLMWTPYGMCAETVNVFKQVADAVKAGDRELLEKQISVSKPQSVYSETDGYVIRLKESDLTADKMLSLLKQLYK